ncbi:transketolase [Kyrpidia spormannii]|uniref:Transketolase n=1 Tax=Kyrpidia spormannii TaxID=2055160 RepID=A0A6F9EG31_9BACL|nr:transketolase [Kyrpidia spormannii]CAB3395896.1 transketolase [Kyrpidia spormannii]
MSAIETKTLQQKAISALRVLSIDAIETARSGHPGLPMGAAPMAYALWVHHLRHDPGDPEWPDRDRFILSAGHGSALLYSLLHLTGYDLSLEELKQFRQWGSQTPGHPEYGHTPGVEATTGPLGQGIAMAVGMAMAERHLAARLNRPGFPIVDHHTYVLASDGDLMEGVSQEASSLAGHLKLGKLIVLYDSNGISLDGSTSLAFTENVRLRYEAYGWHTLLVEDGNDVDAILGALEKAKAVTDRPSLIEVRTVIGYGSPTLQGTSRVHGAPLGPEELRRTREFYGWNFPPFHIPEDVRDHFLDVRNRGRRASAAWREMFAAYRQAHPDLAKQFEDAWREGLPSGWEEALPRFPDGGPAMATRDASHRAIQGIARVVPWWIGGSADLASSNKTAIANEPAFGPPDYSGRNIWFGVREHAMGAILNGMALHGGLRVFGATFLVFSDYMRPAMRLAALMGLRVVYVLTHDSLAVGEDGPTHQPVEHLAALRAIPGMTVFRPADARETTAAYRYALDRAGGPTAIVLTRQALPLLPRGDNTEDDIYEGVARGAYIVADSLDPQAILIATGSEVHLALAAHQALAEAGIPTRVVSMPSWERFEAQTEAEKDRILPPHLEARVAIELGRSLGWERYVGKGGRILSVDTFGASAPGEVVVENYGFTVENVVEAVRTVIGERG